MQDWSQTRTRNEDVGKGFMRRVGALVVGYMSTAGSGHIALSMLKIGSGSHSDW